MAEAEKPHFSSRTLGLSEGFQKRFGHTLVGGFVTNVVAGSNSPMFRQLVYQSKDVSSSIAETVSVEGDKFAGRFPRRWPKAIIMAIELKRLSELKAEAYEEGALCKEAVAYIADDVVHVGSKRTEGILFTKLNYYDVAIAMRRGRGPLQATMGIWLPETRHFEGVSGVKVVEPSVQISALTHDYPGTLLV